VFLVSHDRMFLDNVVTQVIVAEGDGQWREYVGGYTDWERVKAAAAQTAKSSAAKPAPTAAPTAAPSAAPKNKKLSYKEQRELEELPKLIASLEDEQSAITLQLGSADFYRTNPGDAKRLTARVEEIESQLLKALERWEEIEGRTN
jgi:ATP-binding cassette subfamily F protein uup